MGVQEQVEKPALSGAVFIFAMMGFAWIAWGLYGEWKRGEWNIEQTNLPTEPSRLSKRTWEREEHGLGRSISAKP